MRRPFLLSAVIGFAIILISIALLISGPRQTGELAEGFVTPIIAFEFARSNDDVRLIFFDNAGQLLTESVDAVKFGTQLDFLFMAVYGLFLLTFSLTSISLTGNRLFYIAAVLSILAPIFDLLENLQLLSILSQLENGSFIQELQRLQLFTWLKWGCLSLVFLVLMPFFQKTGGFGRFIAFIAALTFGLGISAYILPGMLNELFALSVSVLFLLLFIFSILYQTPQLEKINSK